MEAQMLETQVEPVPLAQAAKRLGLSWGQAWRLLLTGRLCGEKVSGRWFVTGESVDAYARTQVNNASL